MLYKNQDYVNFDQFVSCFVMVSVNNAFIFSISLHLTELD